MNHKQSILLTLESYLDRQEQFLDSFIDSGSEQELFIASYIHGHFSVVGVNFLNTIQTSSESRLASLNETDVLNSFNLELKDSVNQAINKGELEQSDAKLVLNKLNQLFQF